MTDAHEPTADEKARHQREYGDGNKWHAIYDANRDKIKNPDLIHPGQILTIPPAS